MRSVWRAHVSGGVNHYIQFQGDTIVLCGLEGPIVTTIRALLMPDPLRDVRVKNSFHTHKFVVAAQGVKIAAKDLEKAVC